MLTIPSSVVALFKQDGVHKNFRVHFPNGEMSDLTNDNIVQESVKFTESVCSQDVFKFGLTEASTIEFETVGVANMYGMTIECSCEIDCSSLSAADKTAIAAGTWDGIWDGVNAVFSVPYGTFRVESCPRDHQAMTHRRVTAYTEDIDTETLYETIKTRSIFTNSTEYTVDNDAVFWSTVFAEQPGKILDYGYTKRELTIVSSNGIQLSSIPVTINGIMDGLKLYPDIGTVRDPDYNNRLVDFYTDYGAGQGGRFYSDCLVSIESGDGAPTLPTLDTEAIKTQMVADLRAKLEPQGYDPSIDGYTSYEEMVALLFESAVKERLSSFMEYSIVYAYKNNTVYSRVQRILPATNTLIYPFYSSKSVKSVESSIEFVALKGWHFQHFGTNFGQGTLTAPKIFLYANQNPLGQKTTYQSTLSTNYVDTWNHKAEMYSFSNAYSMRDFIQGQLEIKALFLSASRAGGNRLLRIDNTSPASIIPGEYSQMWFDEYTVDSIGTVRYAYTDDAGEEQVVDYQFGSGESVYDMTDNTALKLMEGADPATIEAMLDASFIPYLSPVNFVPIDLTMKGLPYIEAGDALSVTAQDGTVCSSFALRHEISGIQALEAQIDSESGLIIDSGEGS